MVRIVSVLACLPLCVACPGGDPANGQTVGELTSQERVSLCEELRPYVARSWTADCTATALEMDPSAGAKCVSERKSCIDDSTEANCAQVDDLKGECQNVLVDDIRDCARMSAELNERRFGKNVDCSTGVLMGPEPEIPASCNRVHQVCPDPVTMTSGMTSSANRPVSQTGFVNSSKRDPEGRCLAPSEVGDFLRGWEIFTLSTKQIGMTDEYTCGYFAGRDGSVEITIDKTTTNEQFEAAKAMNTKGRTVGTFGDPGYNFYYVKKDFDTYDTLYALRGSMACSINAETSVEQLRLILLRVYANLDH